MPRELVATAPRTPVIREYEETPLGPDQIRIVTEFGIARPPFSESLRRMVGMAQGNLSR